jgi:type VI secretion system protein VasG
VDNILTNTMLPEISRQVLARMAEEKPSERVSISVSPEGQFTYTW